MEKRFLGNSGLSVSVFSFGAMTFGPGKGMFSAIGNTQHEAARATVEALFEIAAAHSAATPGQVALNWLRPPTRVARRKCSIPSAIPESSGHRNDTRAH
jgi:aryl-alcohol dehydrogenase-like predicted oxidoreductase